MTTEQHPALIARLRNWPGLTGKQLEIGSAILAEGGGATVELFPIMERLRFTRSDIRETFPDPNGPILIIEGLGRWYASPRMGP